MKMRLILVGKTVDRYIREGMAVYEGRLGHYIPFSVEEIPELKQVSALTRDQIKIREGELVSARIKPSDWVVLLDERGPACTSLEWADRLRSRMSHSPRDIVFVIGGAYGFSKAVYDRADSLLSLSKMTFSHQIVRLIFMEQIYRAFTIIHGEPYHHE